MVDLLEIKEREKVRLLELDGVVSVGVGKKEIKGMETDEDAIIVGVEEKVPEEELEEDQIVPKELGNGVKTDCQEYGVITAPPMADKEKSALDKIKDFFTSLSGKSRKDKWRPFPLGVSIAHEKVTAGSSGWILKDDEGNEYPSSNNHVDGNSNKGERGDAILQPGPYDGGTLPDDKCGELAGYIELKDGVKVDVAWINATVEYENRLLGIGVPNAPLHKAEVGDVVVKSGRTTGVTRGEVKQAHADVKVKYPDPVGTIVRSDVAITGKMLEGGDSGDACAFVEGDKIHPTLTGFAGSDRVSVFDRGENVQELTGMKIKTEEAPPEKPTAEVTLTLEKKEAPPPEEGRIVAQVNEKKSGNPIVDALVKADGPTPGEKHSDSGGKAVFDSVEIGPYTISAEKKGCKPDSEEITENDFDGEGKIPDPMPILDVSIPEGWIWYEDETERNSGNGWRSAEKMASTKGELSKPNITVHCIACIDENIAKGKYEGKERLLPPPFRHVKSDFLGDQSEMWVAESTKTATIEMRWKNYVIKAIPFQVNHNSVDEAKTMAEQKAGEELENMKKQQSGVAWIEKKEEWI